MLSIFKIYLAVINKILEDKIKMFMCVEMCA